MAAEDLASANTSSWLYRPEFPEYWERRPLYSLAEWVNGLAFRDIQFSPSGKPVIKIAEIKGGISGQTSFTDQVFDESVHVRSGDLLFAWSGQPETSIDVSWWRGPDGWLNQHVFRVTPHQDVDQTFFHYLLRYLKPNFVGIARNKQTTGLGHVTKRDLESIEAAYPPLPQQRAIAHILGTLDEKIELNRRTNEALEAIARALFNSWFVAFDPVHAIAAGRDPGLPEELAGLFPDSFVNSEIGALPDGWRVGAVANVAEINAKTLSSADPLEVIDYIEISEVVRGEIGTVPRYERGMEPSRARRRLRHGDTVLSTVRPDRASHFLCLDPPETLIASTGFAVLSPRDENWAFLYCAVTRPEVGERLGRLADGGAYPAVRADAIGSLSLAIPPTSALSSAFQALASPLFARANKNRVEGRTLGALRDALLPRLISGGIRIADAERLTSEPG